MAALGKWAGPEGSLDLTAVSRSVSGSGERERSAAVVAERAACGKNRPGGEENRCGSRVKIWREGREKGGDLTDGEGPLSLEPGREAGLGPR